MRIAVVGARGQLGAAVAEACGAVHETVTFTRADLDTTDDAAVAAAMARVRPDAIVNASAYTNVDGAEDEPVTALKVNALAVRALARAAETHGAALVHFSTDFVFDGTASAPYTEHDRPNPRSVYATSKLLGEWFALEAPRAYVLRVESLFGRASKGPEPKGSVAAIHKGLLAGQSPSVFIDRTISPTYVIDAAHATRKLLESSAPAGLYHCVNSGSCTWLDFAQELARLAGLEPRMTPVRMSDLQLRAARPLYCVLANAKLRDAGIDMPSWQDALARYVAATGAPSPTRG
jgi:dTDP-4-dehydrorhamnose reductase